MHVHPVGSQDNTHKSFEWGPPVKNSKLWIHVNLMLITCWLFLIVAQILWRWCWLFKRHLGLGRILVKCIMVQVHRQRTIPHCLMIWWWNKQNGRNKNAERIAFLHLSFFFFFPRLSSFHSCVSAGGPSCILTLPSISRDISFCTRSGLPQRPEEQWREGIEGGARQLILSVLYTLWPCWQ